MTVDDLTLPHTFINAEISAKASKLVRKLPRTEIVRLIERWATVSAHNAPPAPWLNEDGEEENGELDEEEKIQYAHERINSELDHLKSLSKAELLQAALGVYWRKGLNLFQVAEIELTILLDYPKLGTQVSWNRSILTEKDKDVGIPIAIESDSFLKNFENALYPFVLGHSYITELPDLSLTVIRVQSFEPKVQSSGPLKPSKSIYLAFPSASPYFLHTFSNRGQTNEAFYGQALSQAIVRTFSTPNKQAFIKNYDSIPSTAFRTLVHSAGASRHAMAQGRWQIYADNKVDLSPLDHNGIPPKPDIDSDGDEDVQILNIKFTGESKVEGTYRSKHPHTIFEAKIKDPIRAGSDQKMGVTLRFEGDDIFAGIHSLALQGIVDVHNLPAWLTGEEATSSGVVEGQIFVPH